MTIKINNKEVKFENGVYSYFSCTCHEDDENFWDNIVEKITGNPEGEQSNALVYTLSHCFDAVINNLWADMWMGFSVTTEEYKLSITTDQLHYGLACAVLILCKLNPCIAEEYDHLNEILNE